MMNGNKPVYEVVCKFIPVPLGIGRGMYVPLQGRLQDFGKGEDRVTLNFFSSL